MQKPAIYLDFINRPSWKTDSIYAEIVKWPSTRPWKPSIWNSNEENGHSSQFLFVSKCISASRVIRCLKVGAYLSNKGLTYIRLLNTLKSPFIPILQPPRFRILCVSAQPSRRNSSCRIAVMPLTNWYNLAYIDQQCHVVPCTRFCRIDRFLHTHLVCSSCVIAWWVLYNRKQLISS